MKRAVVTPRIGGPHGRGGGGGVGHHLTFRYDNPRPKRETFVHKTKCQQIQSITQGFSAIQRLRGRRIGREWPLSLLLRVDNNPTRIQREKSVTTIQQSRGRRWHRPVREFRPFLVQ